MIPRGLSYDDAMRTFRWPTPERFNIGRAVCERHAPDTLAMIVEAADGSVRNWTFGELLAQSSRLANALAGLEEGITTLDASLGGLGGCPFAPGASGNIVTEDLVFMLEAMGLSTGIDLPRLLAVRRSLGEWVSGESIFGFTADAGLPMGFGPPA